MNIIFIDNWINIFSRFDFIAKRYFKIRFISYYVLFCVLLYFQELNFNTIIVFCYRIMLSKGSKTPSLSLSLDLNLGA